MECDILGETVHLIGFEVLGEIANWVADTRHTIGHYSQYMYINDIYFYLNIFQVLILLDRNDAKEEMFLMLDKFQLSMISLDRHLGHIESHLGLP